MSESTPRPFRQKLLFLYLGNTDLYSDVIAWSYFDGTSEKMPDMQQPKPPYRSAVHAMRDGWRVIQVSPVSAPVKGNEFDVNYLKHEIILGKIGGSMSTTASSSNVRSLPHEKPRLDRRHLLNSKQMAKFVSDGFLRFDEIVPRDLCEELMAELEAGIYNNYETEGRAFSSIWPDPLAAGRIFRLPAVQGIIESLVGPDCRYDHHFPHARVGPDDGHQMLHQDAEIDPRENAFDIQFSLFPQDTPLEKGGTLFVPGSHFRRVHESEVARYQNIVGQMQAVCSAGTLYVWHHNLWHAGRANRTPTTRYMFKLRLNPMVRQVRLWNTDDVNEPEVLATLRRGQPWHAQQYRVEFINRMKLWRALTGDPTFDSSFYLMRTENEPVSGYVR